MRGAAQMAGRMLAAAVVIALATGATALEGITPLVTPAWLAERLDDDPLVVIDIRGAGAFAEGHVPGAVPSTFPGFWRGPRGTVPPVATLEAEISALGVDSERAVVIVPAGTGSTEFGTAARVYWTFKYLGHDAVAILDGGWKAWSAEAGNPVATGDGTATPATFTASVRPELLATTPQVADRLGTDTILIDARPEAQYLGESKDGSVSRLGHIPGAISLPNHDFYDAGADRLKPRGELASIIPEMFRNETDADIIAYCNSGWWSATNWFVLHELLGYENAALYVESMAGWSAEASLPVETEPNDPADLAR